MSINYTPSEEDNQQAFEKKLIPNDTIVTMRFTDAKYMQNDRGWKGLKLSGIIIEGEFKDQFMDEMITLENTNSPQAVKIGRQTLFRLCKAIGISGVTHESQLLGVTFIAKIKDISDKNPEYPNAIKAYKMHPSNPHSQGGQAPAQPVAQAPAQPAEASPFGGDDIPV